MPGRPSARSSTATRNPRKSSVPAVDSRKSVPQPVIPEEGPVTALRTQICSVFAESQKSTATHRKLVVSLRKIQEVCCFEQEPGARNSLHKFVEQDFNDEASRCILRLLPIKKSEAVADKVVRFLGAFLRHASEKGGHPLCDWWPKGLTAPRRGPHSGGRD